MAWRDICKEYWKVNSDNRVDQFCNGRSFAMAMRLKYRSDLDRPKHHWNAAEPTKSLDKERHRDYTEYLDVCQDMNQAPDFAGPQASRKKGSKKKKGPTSQRARRHTRRSRRRR